jgi:predicted PurR-regulated permease PerM
MTRKGRLFVAALVLGGLVLATGWGLWTIRPVLAPFLFAILIAYLLAPLVNGVARWGLSRGWAILLVYVLLGLVGALSIWKILPSAVVETRRLAQAIPSYAESVRNLVIGFQQRVRTLGVHPDVIDMVDRNLIDIENRSLTALEALVGPKSLGHMVSMLASLILAPFLAFYLLKDMERFKERFVRTLPQRYRPEIVGLLRSVDGVLAGFVHGQILLALIVGTLAATACWLLGLRYALLIGIWAGLTECIPYVGPLLGAIPALLTGFGRSTWLGLETALAFAAIQQFENAVLSPKIMGDRVGLHPVVVMFSVLAGGYLLGAWGLILALPMAGILRVLWLFLIARLTEPPLVAPPAARPEASKQ